MDENSPLLPQPSEAHASSSTFPTQSELVSDDVTDPDFFPEPDQPQEGQSIPISSFSEDQNLLPQSTEQLTRHQLAAWIIDETMRGQSLTESKHLPKNRSTRDNYLFFENSAFIRQFAVALLVFLSFYELPSWCSSSKQCLSPDGSDLFLSGVPYLSVTTATSINIFLLAILIYFAIFDTFRLPRASLHFNSKWLGLVLLCLVIDVIWCLIYSGYPPFRPAPFIRALLPIFYWDALRECTFAVVAVVSPFCDVFTFLTLFTLLFGWITTLLFHDTPAADQYFGDLSKGLYSAFTSLTTADWPMQIMAVLDVSRQSTLMFIVFIVIGVFFLFNVLLAVVYNAYTGYIEELVVSKLYARRKSLNLAYQILTENDQSCNLNDIKLVFEELRKNKRHADINDETIDLMFTALDDNNDGSLSRIEFSDVIDVLRLQFIVEMENISPMERFFPSIYDTQQWHSFATYIRSPAFSYLIDIIMFLNIIVVIIETTMDLRHKDTTSSILFFAGIEILFSLIYIVEMVLRVLSQGFDRYWKDMGNRFDFIVTWLLLLGAAYVLYPFSENDPVIVRYLVLLRCLRLIAILADIPRFRRLVQIFSILIPASVPLFSFFFLSLYIFAAAGTELFGGLIYASNPKLNPKEFPLVTGFVSNDYWALNFNDMAAGWHTLFSTVIVAYMTEIAEAIASTSAFGRWTKLFFVFNFIVNCLIVSNCVVAFVVDLFVMEDEQESEDQGMLSDLEGRYGTKRVKILLDKNTADQVYRSMFSERVREVIESFSVTGSE